MYMYICIYVSLSLSLYIYIYILRERDAFIDSMRGAYVLGPKRRGE